MEHSQSILHEQGDQMKQMIASLEQQWNNCLNASNNTWEAKLAVSHFIERTIRNWFYFQEKDQFIDNLQKQYADEAKQAKEAFEKEQEEASQKSAVRLAELQVRWQDWSGSMLANLSTGYERQRNGGVSAKS
jgi:hypothetical protein